MIGRVVRGGRTRAKRRARSGLDGRQRRLVRLLRADERRRAADQCHESLANADPSAFGVLGYGGGAAPDAGDDDGARWCRCTLPLRVN